MVEISVLEQVAEIFASMLDADAALSKFLDLARSISGSPWGAIYLRDEARSAFLRWAAARDTPSIHLPLEFVDGIFSGLTHLLLLLDDPRFDNVPAIVAARTSGLRSALGLPLRYGGVLVGVLGLAFENAVAPDDTRLRTLVALSSFPAAAIKHARTRETGERRAHHQEVLRRFGERALATVEIEALHRLILETVVELTGSDQASITRVFGARMRVIAGIGKDEYLVGTTAPVDAVSEVLSAEGPYVVSDVALGDPESLLIKLARKNQAASFMALAMRHQDQVVGHLFAGAAESHRYREDEVEAMRILASMAAAVLEQRRAQAAAEQQRRQLAATLEHLPISIEVYGPHGGVLQANAAARALLAQLGVTAGSARDPFPGRRLLQLGGRPFLVDDLPPAQALRGVHPPPCEVVVADAEGARLATLLLAAAPIYAADGREVETVVVGCQDVSKLHELAEAKDRFLRVASHELRTPITSMLATTQLLVLDPATLNDPIRRDAMLARIDRQARRLVRLVEQLLDSARLNAGDVPLHRVPVDLVALCRDVMELTAATGGPRLVLRAESPVLGTWDPLRIEQVLTNLLSNAVRYSPADSEVTVQVSAEADHALLSVSDHGIGIPARQIEHLFTPFFRGSNAHARYAGGLGLGLHIAQEIVRRHGGDIRVRSVENGGTTFVVALPLTT